MNKSRNDGEKIKAFFIDQMASGRLRLTLDAQLGKLNLLLNDLRELGSGTAGHILSENPLLDLILKHWITHRTEESGLGFIDTFVGDVEPSSRELERRIAERISSQGAREVSPGPTGDGHIRTEKAITLQDVLQNLPEKQVLLIEGLNSLLKNCGDLREGDRQGKFNQVVEMVSGLVRTVLASRTDVVVLVSWPKWLADELNLSMERVQPATRIELEDSVSSSLARTLLEKTALRNTPMPDTDPKMLDTSLVFKPPHNAPFLTYESIGTRLSSANNRKYRRPPSMEEEVAVKEVLTVLASDDKRTYGSKRDAIKRLSSLEEVNLAPVIAKIIEQKMKDFETEYGEQLARTAIEDDISVDGSHPKYTATHKPSRRKFEIDVRVPWVYVLVDGEDIPNKSPQGVIREIVSQIPDESSHTHQEISDKDFADIFESVHKSLSVTGRDRGVAVDDIVSVITQVLRLSRVLPKDLAGKSRVDWVRERMGSKSIGKKLSDRHLRFESGKEGGILLEGTGKRATIVVKDRRRGDEG